MDKKKFIVGLFVLISFLSLGFLGTATFFKSDFFKDWVIIYAKFDDTFGLKSGNEVTMRGQKVGYVENLYLTNDHVLVEMKIDKSNQNIIYNNVTAELLQKNFVVGDWWITLQQSDGVKISITDFDTIKSDLPIQIDKTVEKSTRLVETIEVIFKHIMEGKGVLGDLYVSDSLVKVGYEIGGNTNNLLKKTDKFFNHANHTVRRIDTLITSLSTTADKGNYAVDSLLVLASHLNKSIISANVLVKELTNTPQDIHLLIQNLDSVVSEIDTVFNALERHWLLRGTVNDMREEGENKNKK